MKEKSILRVSLFSLLFAFSSPLLLPAQHVHDNHPPTLHGAGADGVGWKRVSLTASPTTPIVAQGPGTWVVLVNHTETNDDCETSTLGVDTTRSITHQCTVGGKVTIGGSVEAAAGALFTKCAATASASVELNGNYSETSTETVTIKSSKAFAPCDIKKYTFAKLKKTASGNITTWDHKIVCKKGSRTAVNYCNKTTLTGSASGWGESRGVWQGLGRVDPCPCDEDKPPVAEPPTKEPIAEEIETKTMIQ